MFKYKQKMITLQSPNIFFKKKKKKLNELQGRTFLDVLTWLEDEKLAYSQCQNSKKP